MQSPQRVATCGDNVDTHLYQASIRRITSKSPVPIMPAPIRQHPLTPLPDDAITRANIQQINLRHTIGEGQITNFAWSTDETQLAVATSVKVSIYDPQKLDQPPLLLPQIASGIPERLAYSPDGRYLLVNYGDTVVFWDAKTYTLVHQIKPDVENGIKDIIFNPSGNLAVILGGRGISLWDITETPTLQAQNTTLQVKAATFSPEDRSLITIGVDVVSVLDTQTFSIQNQYEYAAIQSTLESWSFNAARNILTISSNLHWIESNSIDRSLIRINLNSGQVFQDDYLSKFGTSIYENHHIAFSSDGDMYIIDETEQTHDIDSLVRFDHYSDAEWSVFSPDGSLLAIITDNNQIYLHNQEGLIANLYGINGWAKRAIFSPKGSYLAVLNNSNTLHVLSTTTHYSLGSITSESRGSTIFNPEVTMLITRHAIWDLQTGEEIPDTRALKEHASTLTHMTSSGRLLFVSYIGGIQDLETGETILKQQQRNDILHMSMDGEYVIYQISQGDQTTDLKVIDLNTGETVGSLIRLYEMINRAWLSRDNRALFVNTPTHIDVWDWQNQTLIAQFPLSEQSGYFFIADAKLMLSGDGGSLAWIEPQEDNKFVLAHVNLQTNALNYVSLRFAEEQSSNKFNGYYALNGDGTLVAVGYDKDILIYDTATGELLMTLEGKIENISFNSLVFSADGRQLISITSDSILRIWGID